MKSISHLLYFLVFKGNCLVTLEGECTVNACTYKCMHLFQFHLIRVWWHVLLDV